MIVLSRFGVHAKDAIQAKLMDSLENTNPIFMMSDSGARGNASNFTQLAGMRGSDGQPGWSYH